MKAAEILLFITTLFSGLMAGLFYSYSCSVVPGLGKLSDPEYLKAMQSINREIQNLPFFICFLGLVILLPASAFMNFQYKTIFVLLLVAAGIYVAGVFGVTIAGNVPLNEKLDAFDIVNATGPEISKHRFGFERRWNLLNLVRTISATATAALMIYACMISRCK